MSSKSKNEEYLSKYEDNRRPEMFIKKSKVIPCFLAELDAKSIRHMPRSGKNLPNFFICTDSTLYPCISPLCFIQLCQFCPQVTTQHLCKTTHEKCTALCNIPAPSKICSYEVSSRLQKLFTNSSLTDDSRASTTKQESDNCCSKFVSSVSFPVPKLKSQQYTFLGKVPLGN